MPEWLDSCQISDMIIIVINFIMHGSLDKLQPIMVTLSGTHVTCERSNDSWLCAADKQALGMSALRMAIITGGNPDLRT